MSQRGQGMVVIRSERAADAQPIGEVVRRAFGREAEADLVQAIRQSDGWIGELSIVAEVDGEIIGHALLSRIAIDDGTGSIPALALAPVAVAPERQNRGVGQQLVRAGIERARELGERLVVVVGHPNYYPRFGFRPARAQGILPPAQYAGIRDEVFMALDLAQERGAAVHGRVIYPATFAGV